MAVPGHDAARLVTELAQAEQAVRDLRRPPSRLIVPITLSVTSRAGVELGGTHIRLALIGGAFARHGGGSRDHRSGGQERR